MSTRKQTTIPQRRNRQISRLVVMNPSKGTNNLVSPALINDKEFSQSLNIEYDEGGVSRKRNGYTQVLDDLTDARGLGVFVTESVRHICTIDSGTFKYATTSSWTSVGTVSFTADAEYVFTQARNMFFIWNGIEGGATWDGSTLARPGTMPKAKFALYFQGVHLAAGVDGQPNRLYISTVTDAGDFTNAATTLHDATEVPGATVFAGTGANFVDIRPNDGDRITGISRFQDLVIVYKERSIYQFSFDDAGIPLVSPVSGSTGCVSHRSIENVENDVYFLSREGIRVLGNEPNFFTAIRTNVLSVRIQPTLDSINPTYYAKCNAHYFDNKYILSTPTTSNDISSTLVYDRRFQAWSVWNNFNANAYVRFVDSQNREFLYFLDDDGTKVYRVTPGTYNDNGSAINAFLVSKSFDMDNPDILKYFTDIGLVFRRLIGQVGITIYVDSGTLLGSGTLAQGSSDGMGLVPLGMQILGEGTGIMSEDSVFADEPQRIVVNTNSRTIKFRIENNRNNEGFVFLGYIIAFYPYTHFNFDSSKKIYL